MRLETKPGTGYATGLSLFRATGPIQLPYWLIKPVVMIFDPLIVIAASVVAGIAYHRVFHGSNGDVQMFLAVGLLVGLNVAAFVAARGSYAALSLVNFKMRWRETTAIWIGVIFVFLAAVFLLKISTTLSRGSMLSFAVAGWVALIGWRLLVSRYLANAFKDGAFAKRKVVIIGEPEEIETSIELGDLRKCGFKPVATISFPERAEMSDGDLPESVNGALRDAISAARKTSAEEIFLAMSWSNPHLIDNMVAKLRGAPIPVRLIPDRNIRGILRKPMVEVGPAVTFELQRAPLSFAERAVKRLFDIVFSSLALLFFLPLYPFVALLIKLDSSGPIFFRQTRNGFNDKEFRIFKFRSLSVLEDGGNIKQVTRNDKRVTRLGRWLRRTSIDELPQFLNVLKGDMSLVGPRPHAAQHNSDYEKLIANYAHRHHAKPGITGWAQVNGLRGETRTVDQMERRVELDLWYIDNWSLWLDIRILLRTFLVILERDSAY